MTLATFFSCCCCCSFSFQNEDLERSNTMAVKDGKALNRAKKLSNVSSESQNQGPETLNHSGRRTDKPLQDAENVSSASIETEGLGPLRRLNLFTHLLLLLKSLPKQRTWNTQTQWQWRVNKLLKGAEKLLNVPSDSQRETKTWNAQNAQSVHSLASPSEISSKTKDLERSSTVAVKNGQATKGRKTTP